MNAANFCITLNFKSSTAIFRISNIDFKLHRRVFHAHKNVHFTYAPIFRKKQHQLLVLVHHTVTFINDLAKLDVEYRRLMRMVVGPPADTNWVSPWHDILHGWNNKEQMLPWLVTCMEAVWKFASYVATLPPERWSGPAGFANGTPGGHRNVGDQPTLGKGRCKNTPSTKALTIGLRRLLHMNIKC